MTVLIHHINNSIGLATLLVALQPQLSTDDDIYLVDSSEDRSGLKIAKLYGSNRCFIFVEVSAGADLQKAVGFATQSMNENKQNGLLVIDENCVISQTFISNLKKAVDDPANFKTLLPGISFNEFLNPNFKWFNPPHKSLLKVRQMQDYCYFESARENAREIGVFLNELVVVLKTPKVSS